MKWKKRRTGNKERDQQSTNWRGKKIHQGKLVLLKVDHFRFKKNEKGESQGAGCRKKESFRGEKGKSENLMRQGSLKKGLSAERRATGGRGQIRNKTKKGIHRPKGQ